MHTCLRDEVPSLGILGKRVLFLAKFMQPVNFFFGTFFFFHEKKKVTGGSGVKPPKKVRGTPPIKILPSQNQEYQQKISWNGENVVSLYMNLRASGLESGVETLKDQFRFKY